MFITTLLIKKFGCAWRGLGDYREVMRMSGGALLHQSVKSVTPLGESVEWRIPPFKFRNLKAQGGHPSSTCGTIPREKKWRILGGSGGAVLRKLVSLLLALLPRGSGGPGFLPLLH